VADLLCTCRHPRGEHGGGYAYGEYRRLRCRACGGGCLEFTAAPANTTPAPRPAADERIAPVRRPRPAPVTRDPGLVLPGEVARLFGVDPKTVARWAASGRIPYITTPGGHRRFRETDVRRLLEQPP